MSSTLAGGFLSTAPSGKSLTLSLAEQKFLILMNPACQLFISGIISLVLNLKIYCHIDGPLDFLLCYLP